ncbi:MAG TPA: hypothetical protein VFZ66_22230 [Herpetosiphonaceae bacterium]
MRRLCEHETHVDGLRRCGAGGEEIGRIASFDLVQRAARSVESGSAGLPVGVQVIARPWQDHVVLAVMQAIECAAQTCDDYPYFEAAFSEAAR